MPKSGVAKFPYLEHDGILAFAHRGGAGNWPENTMPAFQGAMDLGFRYIETDVHATRDGVLLAFHDDQLDRVTDKVGVIAEMDFADVSRARVDGIEHIPRLEELLLAFPQARINIDPKRDNAMGPLIAALRDCNAVERVCVTSFSGARIAAAREALHGAGAYGDCACAFFQPVWPAWIFVGQLHWWLLTNSGLSKGPSPR